MERDLAKVEAAGSSPVSRSLKAQYLLGFFYFVLHFMLHSIFKVVIYQLIHLLSFLRKCLHVHLFHDSIRLPSAAFLGVFIWYPEQRHDRSVKMPEVMKRDMFHAVFILQPDPPVIQCAAADGNQNISIHLIDKILYVRGGCDAGAF